MAFDERMADRIRDSLGPQVAVVERRMFGGLAFLWRSKMFACVVGEDLMVRVGKEQAAEALKRPHVRPMDFTGKPLAGYIYVAPEGVDLDEELERYLQAALAFVATLPAA